MKIEQIHNLLNLKKLILVELDFYNFFINSRIKEANFIPKDKKWLVILL